jgi:hypothetical protein
MKALILVLLGSLSFGAFAAEAPPVASPEPMILYRIVDKVPVKLRKEDRYGVMLINDGDRENPSPRYILAIAASRTLVDTKDLQTFEDALAKIPKGAVIHTYDSCSCPRSFGLNATQWARYEALFIKHGLKRAAEERITCYCRAVSA